MSAFRSKKILLVEDETIVAISEGRMLKKHGYEVVTVYDGEKAVETADTDRDISLVLMDIDLGAGIDGTEAAESILHKKDIPIVFLTNHAEQEFVEKVKRITRYGYVLKSAGEFVLIEAIEMAHELFEAHQNLKAENETRRRIEKDCHEYQRILTSAFNAVDSLLMVIDRQHRVVLSNWKDHEWVPHAERNRSPYCYTAMKNYEAPCPYCPPMTTFQDGEHRVYEDQNPVDQSHKEISVAPIFDDDGSVEYVLENVKDVTERKKKERQLREREKKYRSLFNSIRDAILVADANRNIIDCNAAFVDLFGYRLEEIRGQKTASVYQSQEAFEEMGKALSEHKGDLTDFVFTIRYKRKDDTSFPGETNVFYLRDEQDQVIGFIGLIRDITERKRTEEHLENALEEKDALMSELNHRVKNNLNMVSSLVSLKDSETYEDLSDIKHRIDTIRLVHEKLHQHGEVEWIRAREYLEELLGAVFASYTLQHIGVTYDIADVSIPTKTAISLGFIVNEIATNAVKYGFRPDEEARFTVRLTQDEERKQYTLTLSNTGNPLPEEVDLENPSTMGLQLISALTEQLNGTLELHKQPEPTFIIRFPVEKR